MQSYTKSVLILVMALFVTSSAFASWFWNRNVTRCSGAQCKHVVVKKQCANGRCWDYKHVNTWHR